MNDDTAPDPGDAATPPPNDSQAFSQQFQHNPVSARVPERLARGVLSTSVLILDSRHDFVLDFLQGLTRPHQIVARVIVVPRMLEQFISTLQDNLAKYAQTFGPIAPLPKPSTRRPTIAEIYEDFKLPDEILSGCYANSIIVGHSAAEFFFDFITTFYPTAAVSARIVMSAQQTPRVLDTLKLAMDQYRKRFPGPDQQ
jgi:hypothetical protein